MESRYTLEEVRERLVAHSEEIGNSVAGRLRDDGIFDPKKWSMPGRLDPATGEINVTEEGAEILGRHIDHIIMTVIGETIGAIVSVGLTEDSE